MSPPGFVSYAATHLRQHVSVTPNTLHGIATLGVGGAVIAGAVRAIWGLLTATPGTGYSRRESAAAGAWEGAKAGLLTGVSLGTTVALLNLWGA